MAITVRDIAKAAGVSIGTVSRALKNQPGMAAPTRERVRHIAVELGYDFERLQSGQIRRILFLLHRQHDTLAANAFFSEVLHGAEDACRRLDASLSFLAVGPADPIMRQLARHEADALLCVGYFESELLQVLKQAGKPMVLVDQWPLGFPAINPDNEAGAYAITRHLLGSGRRRIAYLAMSLAHYSIQQRERGYRRALFEAGIPADPALDNVMTPGVDLEMGVAASVDRLLALRERPDAIFAFNDTAALIALRRIQRAGLRVPQDVAIAGFDDIEMASHSQPALTTIRIDKSRLGQRGIEQLVDRATPSEEILPIELIVRGSTG